MVILDEIPHDLRRAGDNSGIEVLVRIELPQTRFIDQKQPCSRIRSSGGVTSGCFSERCAFSRAAANAEGTINPPAMAATEAPLRKLRFSIWTGATMAASLGMKRIG
jgi:hypothetical protein